MRSTFANLLDCFLPLEEIGAAHDWLARQRAPSAVIGALCRAMAHGLPLALALRGAAESERQGSKSARILLALAQDLEAGTPLADALERHARRFLPPHIIPAIRAAEARGQLPAVLPALAGGIERRICIRNRVKACLTFPLVELAVLLVITAFLVVFICPKFVYIVSYEFGVPDQALQTFRVLAWMSSTVMHVFFGSTGFNALIWGPLAFIAVYTLLRCFPTLRDAWLRFWETVPVIGPVRRQIARLELADTLSAATAGNGELLQALRLGQQSCRSPYLRQRLTLCIAAVERGEPWAAAWEEAGLGAPFQNWILRNAATRQDPFSGFMLLRDWLTQEIDTRMNRVSLWLEPCMTCVNSALAALVVFALWQPLIHMVAHRALEN